MGKLRLWICPSTCSLVPHIVFREAGIDFELVEVDMIKGFPDELKRINPKGRVPILEIGDGNVLTEVPAICTYAAHLSPSKNLLGTNILEVARSYEWFNWLSGTVHERGFGGMFRPDWHADDPEQFPSVQRKCKAFLLECLDAIEEKIQGVHSVGNAFTAPDVFLYVIYRWGYLSKWDMPGKYPKWTKLVEEVMKRDSVKAAVEREGIPILEDNRAAPPVVD